jgi:DNA polymerase-1
MEVFQPTEILIDGRNLLYRNADANSGMSWEVDGVDFPTGGLFGFLVTTLRLRSDYEGARLHVCWEGHQRCFRYEMYPAYKAKRASASATSHGTNTPLPSGMTLAEAVNCQSDVLEQVLGAMGIPQWTCPGAEADDAVGALALTLSEDCGSNVLIYSGDGDLRQCVTDKVRVLAPARSRNEDPNLWGIDEVCARYGIAAPGLLPDYKAIVGDSSDNIPGVRGVGKVAAGPLFAAHRTLDGILEAACGVGPFGGPDRTRKLIAASVDEARLYKAVATIRTDMPLTKSLRDPDVGEVKATLARYGCRSLLGSSSDRLIQR